MVALCRLILLLLRVRVLLRSAFSTVPAIELSTARFLALPMRRSKYGIWSSLGGNDQSNYYENDYIASFIIGLSMSPRGGCCNLTTSLCRTGIIGGIDVDNKSE